MDGRLSLLSFVGEFTQTSDTKTTKVTGYADWQGKLIKFSYETDQIEISKSDLFENVKATANRMLNGWDEQKSVFTLPSEKARLTVKKLFPSEVKGLIAETRKDIRSSFERLAKIDKELRAGEKDKRLLNEKAALLQSVRSKFVEQTENYTDYQRGIFRNYLLVKTMNQFKQRWESLSQSVREAYQQEIVQLKKEHPQHKALLHALDNLSEVTIMDLQVGFCSAICDVFTRELEQKGVLTGEDVVRAAKELEEGVLDPKNTARQLLKGKIAEQTRLGGLVTSKKKNPEFYSFIRKVDNLFQKGEGIKQKKLHLANTKGIVVPSDLKPGVYSLNIFVKVKVSDLFIPRKIKNFNHAIAFVKIDEKKSFVFDPSVGLIECGSPQQTLEQLAKLQSYYGHLGYPQDRIQTRISYTVKL